jgi:putative ABC transport system permease protein
VALTDRQRSDAARYSNGWFSIGRLKPGATIEQAKADLDLISRQIEQQWPQSNTNLSFSAVSMHEDITRDYRPALLVMLGAVSLVLLIACANVANLLLARAAARQKEVAIRMALGASRVAVLQMIIGRGITLAAIGVAAGLLVAIVVVRVFATLLFGVTATNLPTYAVSSALLLVVATMASYFPARRAMLVDPVVALRAE